MPSATLPLPVISTTSAHLLTFAFALSYVGSLYVFKNARLLFHHRAVLTRNGEPRQKKLYERWRDDPDVIRARLAAVCFATSLCCACVFAVVWRSPHPGRVNSFNSVLRETLWRLGLDFHLNTDWWTIYPHLVTPLLFLGPLYARHLQKSLPFQRGWSFRRDLLAIFSSLQGLRNYVLAPITEEIVFRACVLSMYHLSAASRKRMIFLSPLSFGAAHIHHAWDTYNRYGMTTAALKRAILMMLFQLTYTTIFGFLTAFLFLRTGSILPPITAHVFCNIMGIPQLGYELRQFPTQKRMITLAYLLGIVAFVYTLWPWTYVQHSLYWQS